MGPIDEEIYNSMISASVKADAIGNPALAFVLRQLATAHDLRVEASLEGPGPSPPGRWESCQFVSAPAKVATSVTIVNRTAILTTI